jgi:hypothetical protein
MEPVAGKKERKKERKIKIKEEERKKVLSFLA